MVSAAAAQVFSGTAPMDLLAEEKRKVEEKQQLLLQNMRGGDVLECARCRSKINELSELLSVRELVIRHLIDEPNKWQKGARIISDIVKAKERDDRENQREDRNEEED
ncbi:hypothetical protein HHI36_007070 [Cryptolaemus montrouzieri]|uniref:Uncharacterized protein n=1 Tax=Cryptolaemus montrouzieri TaxID=559131 RepID=A0ABD2MNE0_9CUCU